MVILNYIKVSIKKELVFISIKRYEVFNILDDKLNAKIQIDCIMDEPSFKFKCYICYGWVNGVVIDKNFECEGHVKCDACSHFWYKGQDFYSEKKFDSYYHVCGVYDYVNKILSLYSILKLAKVKFDKNFREDEELKKLEKSGFFNNYLIKEIKIKQSEQQEILQNW